MKPWDVPLGAASLGWLSEAWGQDLQSSGLILQGLLEWRGDKALRAAQRPPPPRDRQLGIGTELVLGQAAGPPAGLPHIHRWAPSQPPFPNALLGFSCLVGSIPALEPSHLRGWSPALLLPKPAAPPPAGLKGHLSEARSDHQGNTTPQPHSFFLSALVSFPAESSQALSEVPC